jgi:hypothetical protein
MLALQPFLHHGMDHRYTLFTEVWVLVGWNARGWGLLFGICSFFGALSLPCGSDCTLQLYFCIP